MDRQTAGWIGATALAIGLVVRALHPLPPPKADAFSASPPAPAIEGLIGNTPLIELRSLSAATGCVILAKCEHLSPGGSSKDRVALRIIRDAEARGALTRGRGGTLVEGSSGSTGISLALLARALGYTAVVYMPNDVAREKSALLRCLGASVREVPPVAFVNSGHYVRQAAAAGGGEGVDASSLPLTPPVLYCDQFENASNFAAHFEGTGPEIWAQTRGRIDAFVCGAGTGGTIGGVGAYIKKAAAARAAEAARVTGSTIISLAWRWFHSQPLHPFPTPRVFLADPPGSVLYSLVRSGVAWVPQAAERTLRRHRDDTLVEGVGCDRVTANMCAALPHIDGAFRVSDNEMVDMSRHLLVHEGLFLGSSSALNVTAAVKVAKEMGPGHVVVTILCDAGARHMSRLWDDDVLQRRGLKACMNG